MQLVSLCFIKGTEKRFLGCSSDSLGYQALNFDHSKSDRKMEQVNQSELKKYYFDKTHPKFND